MDGNAKKKRKNRNNSATGVTTGETGVLTAKRNVKTIAQTLKAINGRDFTYNDVKLLQLRKKSMILKLEINFEA